jgi:phosphomevalonate kinase
MSLLALPFAIRVPGKLMIAGEYAVLEPHQDAVVAAVNRYLTVTLKPSPENRLCLPGLQIPDVTWTYSGSDVHFSSDDRRLRFIAMAFATVTQYLGGHAAGHQPFCLTVGSDLDDAAGRKYGLGSSACVVVAVVAALLPQFAGGASIETLFKLAAIAHFRAQGSGSGADVAAATFGGWIRYGSFGPDWLSQRLQSATPIADIVQGDWPYLAIERLPPPPDLRLCVGWTGKPAATAPLIQAVQQLRDREPGLYQDFLARSREAVQGFLRGMRTGDTPLVLSAVHQNRTALARLGQKAGILIETPELAVLADLAEALGGAGKPSGAGGGDCGLAIMTQAQNVRALHGQWQANGVQPLPLRVSDTGVTQVT